MFDKKINKTFWLDFKFSFKMFLYLSFLNIFVASTSFPSFLVMCVHQSGRKLREMERRKKERKKCKNSNGVITRLTRTIYKRKHYQTQKRIWTYSHKNHLDNIYIFKINRILQCYKYTVLKRYYYELMIFHPRRYIRNSLGCFVGPFLHLRGEGDPSFVYRIMCVASPDYFST